MGGTESGEGRGYPVGAEQEAVEQGSAWAFTAPWAGPLAAVSGGGAESEEAWVGS